MSYVEIVIVAVVVAILVFNFRKTRHSRAKQEALFVSMFPDLQPHYHPAKLVAFVKERLAKAPPAGGGKVKFPAGFTADLAEVSFATDKGKECETWRLLDGTGNVVTQFDFEPHPEGGVLRVGKGKFTVGTRMPGQPKVRYWHPDREFKWTPALWKFTTRMAEDDIDSSSRGTSWSSDSSSSSSTSTAAAATAGAAAGFAAAGGTFDGGGASQAWSDTSGASSGSDSSSDSGSDSGSSAAAATSY